MKPVFDTKTRHNTRKLQTSRASQVPLNPPASAGGARDGFDPWTRKVPWRRKWHPTPVFLSGEAHGQRSLVGYSLWGLKESGTTEATWHAGIYVA